MNKEELENGLDDELEDDDDLVEDTDAAAEPEKGLPSGTMVMCDDGVERPVITRDEAIEAGKNRYFTGIECQKGHMVERKVKGYVCTTCARIRQKLRKKVRASEDPAFKAAMAKKRAAKHAARYTADADYRRKVLDRAKVRRANAAAAKRLNKAEAEIAEQ